jgi:phage protein D
VTYDLAWGKSLVEFKPTLSTSNQVKSVTVHGWDRTRHEAIEVKVDIDDPELNRNRDLYRLLQRCDPREEIVVNEPVFTRADARRRAIAILLRRRRLLVRATATTVGLPDLRAGQLVQISDVGSRFGGTYFVTDTTHTMDPNNGYTTRFGLYREDPGT